MAFRVTFWNTSPPPTTPGVVMWPPLGTPSPSLARWKKTPS